MAKSPRRSRFGSGHCRTSAHAGACAEYAGDSSPSDFYIPNQESNPPLSRNHRVRPCPSVFPRVLPFAICPSPIAHRPSPIPHRRRPHHDDLYILEWTNPSDAPETGWRPRVRKLGRATSHQNRRDKFHEEYEVKERGERAQLGEAELPTTRQVLIWLAIVLLIRPSFSFAHAAREYHPSAQMSSGCALCFMIHTPHSSLGTVLRTDAAYEFDNGDIESGMLLKDQHGTEAWVKRTNLNKALVPGH